jgi:hypothetical protein
MNASVPRNSKTDEPINRDALKRLLAVIGGDPEDLQDLLTEFETTTPKVFERMKAPGGTVVEVTPEGSFARVSTATGVPDAKPTRCR